jgi:hypothetical protein
MDNNKGHPAYRKMPFNIEYQKKLFYDLKLADYISILQFDP